MANNFHKKIIVVCPINIALVKYWGKRDENLMLPCFDSVSVNFDELFATTTVEVSSEIEKDVVIVNGNTEESKRYNRVFSEIRSILSKRNVATSWHCSIISETNFPASAGLASSAAGFAAIAYGFGQIFSFDQNTVAYLARLGSGSACRSIYSGFVHWLAGSSVDGSDTRCQVIAAREHWPELRAIVAVVSDQHKETSSTLGMQTTVETSALFSHARAHCVQQHVVMIRDAIVHRNFAMLAEFTMRDSNQFHALCMDTFPPLFYLNDTSKLLIQLVHEFNALKGSTKVAYTFDAGPNCCMITLEDMLPEFLAYVWHYFPNNKEEHFLRGLVKPEDVKTNVEVETEKIKLKPSENVVKYVYATKLGVGPFVVE